MSKPDIRIRPYEPRDSTAFRELNEAWIAKYFGLEEPDRLALGDPDGQILRPGGRIFMAVAESRPIGCCALIPAGPGVLELAKMTVAEEYRGQGIGRKMLEYAIAQAKALGAKSVCLGSNARLANAIHLYESFGFRHVPPESLAPSPYARANVFMDLPL